MREPRKNVVGQMAKAIIAVAMLAGCTAAPPRPEPVSLGDYESTKRYVTRLIQYEMKKHNVTGLSVALVDDQKIAWAEGFGYADEAARIAATPDTVYRVGSISKLFTATAAMQLFEQGKLDIDKPLQTYLPEFSIKSRFSGAGPIVPRMLMTHHSGLPDGVLKGMWTDSPEPFTGVVHRIRDEYVAYPPNYIFSYSNLGVTLLGHALEKVAGADFAAHLEQMVLRPLGMAASSLSAHPRSPEMAKAYHDGVEATETALRDVPAGGLNSSANDLSRFLMMVFADGRSGEHRVLKPETLREMLRPQNDAVALDQGFQVGLGWILSGLGGIDIENAGPVAHHAGATLYFRAQMIALPEHKLGVVVLSNSSSARATVNKIATEALKLALEAKAGIRQPKRLPPETGAAPLTKEDLDAYAGYYATALGFAYVARDGNKLRLEISNQSFDLMPRVGGCLGIRYRLFGIFPLELEEFVEYCLSRAKVSGREILLIDSGGQKLVVGEKIAPAPISVVWSNRSGEYEIVNGVGDALKTDKIRMLPRGGFLTVDVSSVLPVKGRITVALAPVSENEAVILGLGRSAGETIRAVTVAGEEHLVYSGYLMKKKLK